MSQEISLLDSVALTENLYDYGLLKGQVGTIVEELDNNTYLVEFSDDEGKTYAMLPLADSQLMVLHYQPSKLELSPSQRV